MNVGRSWATIAWSMDLCSQLPVVFWGLTSGSQTNAEYVSASVGSCSNIAVGITSGTPAASTIYYKVCATSQVGEVQLTVTTAGVGYNHTPLVTLTGGGQSNVTAYVDMSGTGIARAVTDNISFTGTPTVTITPQGGDTPSVTAVITATYVSVATQGCSGVQSYTSAAAASQVPASPIPPTAVPSVVLPTGAHHVVTASDPNAAGGLVSQVTSAVCGDFVDIPANMTIAGMDAAVLPAKSCSYRNPIVIQTTNAGSIFVNSRRPMPTDEPSMGRIINNAPNFELNGSLGTTCYAGQLWWRQGQNPSWSMYRCDNTNSQAILSIPSTGTLTLQVASTATWTTGQIAHISGVTGTGAGAVNGDWSITVVDSTHVTIAAPYYCPSCGTATGPSSGGTMSVNVLQILPYTSVTSSGPSSCSVPGTWYHNDTAGGSPDEYHRTWYCSQNPATGAGEVIPIRFDSSNFQPQPAIDIVTNLPTGLWFRGLSIETLGMPADIHTLQYDPCAGSGNCGGGTRSGNTFFSWISPSYGNNYIYFDNLLMNTADPTFANGTTAVRSYYGISINGASNVHVGSSYLSGFQQYGGTTSLNDTDTATVIVDYVSGLDVRNNYISGAGFGLYLTANQNNVNAIRDVTFSENYCSRPDEYWSPSSPLIQLGEAFATRHCLETKAMQRGWISGNTFSGGWTYNNSGASICLCSKSGPLQSKLNGTSVTLYPPAAGSGGWTATDLKVGDSLGWYTGSCASTMGHHIFTVSTVTDPWDFTINSNSGCPSLTGNVLFYRLNSVTTAIHDVLIENNSFFNITEPIDIQSNDSYPGPNQSGIVGAALQRVVMQNNLAVNIDGSRVIPQSPYYGSSDGGNIIHFDQGGPEDFQYVHNTSVNRNTTTVESYGFTNSWHCCGPTSSGAGSIYSGLTSRDNILEYGNSGSCSGVYNDSNAYFGQGFFTQNADATEPILVADLFQRPGGSSGSPCDPSTSPQGPQPTPTRFFNGAYTTFPYLDPSSDYHILSTSAYASGGASRALDGLSQGADIDSLESASGTVLNAHQFFQSGAWYVGFVSPDTNGCPVEWATNNALTGATVVSNPNGNRVQNAVLSGLPSHATIYWRVDCANSNPIGSFLIP